MRLERCWLCGEPLGKFLVFVIGPMCAINRVHRRTAVASRLRALCLQACPFLTQPKMRRNEKDKPEHVSLPGVMLTRNPGVTMLWTTHEYWASAEGRRRAVHVGDPGRVEFYAEGRTATRERSCIHHTGMPFLREMAERDGPDAVAELSNDTTKRCRWCQRRKGSVCKMARMSTTQRAAKQLAARPAETATATA